MDFYTQIVKTLDEINARYMLVGAFAAYAFGISRSTFDIDIIVDLSSDDADALAARFPGPRYYADGPMMRDSMARGLMFNIIDSQEGLKADLVPLTREPDYLDAFERRIQQTFTDESGNSFDAWCAQPTDIIIGKLRAWAEGNSTKHPSDIYQMLTYWFSGMGTVPIELELITAVAHRLGSDTVTLWSDLVGQARTETGCNEDGEYGL